MYHSRKHPEAHFDRMIVQLSECTRVLFDNPDADHAGQEESSFQGAEYG